MICDLKSFELSEFGILRCPMCGRGPKWHRND